MTCNYPAKLPTSRQSAIFSGSGTAIGQMMLSILTTGSKECDKVVVAKTLVYYRALITPDHLRRWTSREFTSFHHIEPPEWCTVWNQRRSTNIQDYCLDSVIGVFTNAARESFIRLVQEKPEHSTWTPDERRSVSELAGVCAFESPVAAWEYGLIEGEADWRLLVEFGGRKICPAPENGSVVAEVINPIGSPMRADNFRAKYGLKIR
jgi:hypothetical protein